MDLKRMIEERAHAWERMKALHDAARDESRDLEGEEITEYENLEARLTELDEQIDTRQTEREARSERFAEREARYNSPERRNVAVLDNSQHQESPADNSAAMDEFRSFIRGDIPAAAARVLRSMQADNDVTGGYLIAPQQIASSILQNVDDATFIRRLAHIEQVTTADGLGIVSLDGDLEDAEWTGELGPPKLDDGLEFGRRALKPNLLMKEVKVSHALIRRTTGRAEDLVLSRMAYRFGITLEKAYLLGDGQEKPLGIFTPSPLGISTARDVSTDMTTTAITADGLIEVQHSIKPAYWPNLRWLFHRDAIKKIRKLRVANEEQYIWQPGLQAGVPNTILDMPYDMSEFVPNTFTASNYVGALCDWRYYWIVDALRFQIQVLHEFYTRNNQNGYIGRLETDGMPVLEEAFARIKLASE